MSSDLTKTCSAMSCSKNWPTIWSVRTDPRCPQSLSHRLITDVMPMSPDCVLAKTVADRNLFLRCVSRKRSSLSPALSRQVANVASLLELVPKIPNC